MMRLIIAAAVVAIITTQAWAAVPVIASSSYKEIDDDTCRTAKPASLASGELVVLLVGHDRLNPGTGQWATPTGFTKIKEMASNAADVDLAAYYKVAGASEPDSYLVYTGGTSITCGMWALRITGQHETPLNTVAGGSEVSTNTITDTSITTTADSCLVFALGLFDGEDGGPIDNISGTGWASTATAQDEWGTAGSGATFVYDTKSVPTAGGTDNCVIDYAGTVADGNVGFQFAIRGTYVGAALTSGPRRRGLMGGINR